MNFEHVNCNLCGADDMALIFEGRDRLHGLPGTYCVVRCQQCGLVYLNPRPTKEKIGAYYPNDYDPHIAHKRIRQHRLATLDYSYGLYKRRRKIERLVEKGRLLDIGCGNGSFLYYMQEHGWEVYGHEISPAAALYAQDELGLDVQLGQLEEVAFPPTYFDVVTLWNVLEHIHDPTAILLEIRRILKPEGLLVITVPNLDSWHARLFGPAWAGYDVPRHLYTFNPKTLDELLSHAGLKAIDRSCLFGSYHAVAYSLYFSLHGSERWEELRPLFKRVMNSRLLRLLAAPAIRVLDGLHNGAMMTVLCQPVEMFE